MGSKMGSGELTEPPKCTQTITDVGGFAGWGGLRFPSDSGRAYEPQNLRASRGPWKRPTAENGLTGRPGPWGNASG